MNLQPCFNILLQRDQADISPDCPSLTTKCVPSFMQQSSIISQTGEMTSEASGSSSCSKQRHEARWEQSSIVLDQHQDDPDPDIPALSESSVSEISSMHLHSTRASDSRSSRESSIDEPTSRILRTGLNKNNTSKHVSFSTVEIRYHNIILGDNPGCSPGGPPIQIDWKPCAKKSVQLDHFENWREGTRRHGEQQLVIGAFHRHELIKKTGLYKSEDIFDRMDEMEKISRQRKRSVTVYKWRKRLLSW